jgi:hypothetical protein
LFSKHEYFASYYLKRYTVTRSEVKSEDTKMADEKPASGSGDKAAEPAAEELAPQSDGQAPAEGGANKPQIVTQAAKRRHAAYRPSHAATFIGLGVVAFILAANGIALMFLLKGQEAAKKPDAGAVTISSDTLNKLGVSKDNAATDGVTLKINPATNFGSNVTIAQNLAVGGQLNLNGRFTAPDAAFAKLQGGDTQLDKLNVNGDATISTLNLRKDLNVAGITTLQGQVKVSQLMTINNNLNVSGTLSVGGAISVRTLQVSNLQTTGNLTFGGHIITSGSQPNITAGNALGSGGTVSVSGNDTSGSVGAGVGVGSIAGTIATITFRTGFSKIPNIIVSVNGHSVPGMYIVKSASGFSIITPNALSPGAYGFDFITVD